MRFLCSINVVAY